MTDKLDELEALLREATPGPWRIGNHPTLAGRRELVRTYLIAGLEGVAVVSKYALPVDLALIVAAINALPDLIRRVREAECEIADARAAMNRPGERDLSIAQALRNAHHSAELAHSDLSEAESSKALAVREAWEAAAQVCDSIPHYMAAICAANIRAASPKETPHAD